MRLDHTHVRIRERNVLEILDLSFQILRAYWRPLTILLVFGALPLVLLNHWLCAWMLDPMMGGEESPAMYMWHQFLLVAIEAPLGGVLITTYLGHAVFDETPSLGRIFKDIGQGISKFFWSLLGLRCILPFLFIMLFARLAEGEWSVWRVLGTISIVGIAGGIRLFRPFVVELIVLEQPAWRSDDPQQPSFSQRSSQIHNAAAGVLFGRGLLFMLLSGLITWIAFGGLTTVVGLLNHDWFPEGVIMSVVWPASLWLTVGYLTVVRFLNYLDVRIRQEGWEVELLIRAEAQKIEESLV